MRRNNEITSERGEGTCGEILFYGILLVIGLGFLMSLGGDYESTRTDTTTNTTPVLSGNELMSRNQVNLFSEVENWFYECYGPGSCSPVTENTSNNSESTTTSTTRVEGDRNNVTNTMQSSCIDTATGATVPCTLCQDTNGNWLPCEGGQR